MQPFKGFSEAQACTSFTTPQSWLEMSVAQVRSRPWTPRSRTLKLENGVISEVSFEEEDRGRENEKIANIYLCKSGACMNSFISIERYIPGHVTSTNA